MGLGASISPKVLHGHPSMAETVRSSAFDVAYGGSWFCSIPPYGLDKICGSMPSVCYQGESGRSKAQRPRSALDPERTSGPLARQISEPFRVGSRSGQKKIELLEKASGGGFVLQK